MTRTFIACAIFFPAVCFGVAACSGATLTLAENDRDGGAAEAGNTVGPTDGGAQSSPDTGGGGADDAGVLTLDGGSAPDASCGPPPPGPCACGGFQCVGGKWQCGDCADSSVSACNPPCSAGETCVRYQMNGGALLLPDDAGNCPVGRHLQGGMCVQDPSYACEATPAACNGAATCGCASSLCTQVNTCPYQCTGSSPGELDCDCNVP